LRKREQCRHWFTIYDEEDRLVACNETYLDFYRTSRDLIIPGNTFEQIVRKGAERGQYKDALGRIDAWVQERVSLHQAADGTLLEQHLDDGRWLMIVEYRTPAASLSATASTSRSASGSKRNSRSTSNILKPWLKNAPQPW
jgi:hypothetical protein